MRKGIIMKIGTNVPALNTVLTLKGTNRTLTNEMKKLSSGLRINSSKDDAAGLAISDKLSMQIRSLNRASMNTMDGISFVQTADGALDSTMNMLQRMRELAVNAANGHMTPEDRDKIQKEVNSLTDEINANAKKVEFNNIKIFNGEVTTIFSSSSPNATVKYLSEDIAPGTLSFTVNNFGTPAAANIDITQAIANGASFKIGEVEVEIPQGATATQAVSILNKSAELAGLKFTPDSYATPTSGTFTTKKAGEYQEISITESSNPAIITNGVTKGTDAKISPNITHSGAGGSFTATQADGNMFTIVGKNGQEIAINLNTFSGTVPERVDVKIEDYGPLQLQIGGNYNQRMAINIPAINAETLGFTQWRKEDGVMTEVRLLNYMTHEGANEALEVLDDAMSFVSKVRSTLGAYQNRLEHTNRNLDVSSENMEASRSRIQDTDMADTMSQYTMLNVKYQAGISILAQANQRPQMILQLLQ